MGWDSTLLAWAAGFFDGEGHIQLSSHKHQNRTSPNGKYGLGVEVCNGSLKSLERLQEYFGGNIRERKHHIIYKRRIYRWTLSGANAAYFLQQIKPFLCIKANEAELALAFRQTIGKHGIKVDDEVLAYRDHLKFQMQQLHH